MSECAFPPPYVALHTLPRKASHLEQLPPYLLLCPFTTPVALPSPVPSPVLCRRFNYLKAANELTATVTGSADVSSSDLGSMGAEAWSLQYPTVPDRLRSYHEQGFKLVSTPLPLAHHYPWYTTSPRAPLPLVSPTLPNSFPSHIDYIRDIWSTTWGYSSSVQVLGIVPWVW